jgi:small subunit ribosomal protein S1
MIETQTATSGGEDTFAALFEVSLQTSDFGKEGEIVEGTIISIQRDNVIIDIGGKSEGVIALAEFTDAQGVVTIKIGDKTEVYVESRENDDGLVILSKEKADKAKVWQELIQAYKDDELVEGTITQRVKGGLSVTIRGGVKAFLPGSQVDLRPIRNLDKLIGQTYQFKFIKFNERRVLLERERDTIKSQTLLTLEEGKVVKGIIKNITEYGAFVDLGGIDGLLHITDMSWGRVNHPNEVFQVGDEVTVKVLKYNAETERVSLGLKQTQEDPWSHAEEAFPPGKKVKGKIMSITDYGAFVELEPGVEGLIHVSEMSWTKKVKHPSKLLEMGQEVECQVLEVDSKSKRISLGLKQLEPDPWTIFTEKYNPGDKIGGKIRSITDYGVFVGIEEGVDGMVHKSDLSWTAKVNNPSDMFHKGDDVEAIILSINHDEKKVSLGIKQLFDDPWPTIFNDFPPGKVVHCKVLSNVEYGVFVRVQDGIEGMIPHNELIETKNEDGTVKEVAIGDEFNAEIANIDSQERRLTLSMRLGEGAAAVQAAAKTERRPSAMPTGASATSKKTGDEKPGAGTIGDLIKQKLGEKLSLEKE